MAVEIKAAAKAAGKPMAEADAVSAASDSIRAMMLVRTYRVRGHLAANLDPLGLSKQEIPADLTPEYHGFSGADLDRKARLCRRHTRPRMDDRTRIGRYPARQLLRASGS